VSRSPRPSWRSKFLPASFAILLCSHCATLPNAGDPSQPHASVSNLHWLAGHWRAEHAGAIVEEFWTPPEGGLALGLNRVLANGTATFYEFLRLQDGPDAIVYFASPGGGPWVSFSCTELSNSHALFEAPQHDWPQTIRYILTDPHTLEVEVSGIEEGVVRMESLRFSRQEPSRPTP
jgi:hypothetical protein